MKQAKIILLVLLVGCAGRHRAETIDGKAGRFIVGYGFSIDAQYDPQLDSLARPYKLVTVAVRNTSLTVIRMDARKDQWYLIDEKGKKVKGINSLRLQDKKRWSRLPGPTKELVDYPEVVPISYTVTFNLFFPPSASLKNFQEIWYQNAASGKQFRIDKGE